MGIREQAANQSFKAVTTTFTKPGGTTIITGSAVQDMGSSYIVLSANLLSGNQPCAIRLYADAASRETDLSRPLGDFDIDDSVALVADIVFSGSTAITFNPPVIGTTYADGYVYWTISGSSLSTTISVSSVAIGLTGNSQIDRTGLDIMEAAIPVGSFEARGNITTPKSFLILSASATELSRLRLYSRPIEVVSIAEISRSFGVAPADNSSLIADLMFDSAGFQYPLIPILEAYTWINNDYNVGTEQAGYILENLSGAPADVTASLYIYSTED